MFNADREPEKGWDTALICINGHVITSALELLPHYNAPFCRKCGAPTISKCHACGAEIHGDYRDTIISHYQRPAYCHACGKPCPWTEQSLAALKELAYEAKELSPEEQDRLAQSFGDLLIDTPRTEVAVSRSKLLLPKIGREVGDSIKSILVSIATEAVKKQLGI